MRSDYCPIGGQPCQSMCVTPCSTKRRHISYACPVCAASMLESNEALLRQALEALELRCGTHADERKELIPALRERLGLRYEPTPNEGSEP